MEILIAGGGIFGLTAALALRARGHAVTVVEPGPIPHPLAESTDVSKVVRADYGADVPYTALAERALDGWRAWNRTWSASPFVETGVMFVARAPMAPGGFEHDSFALLGARGHRLERLDAAVIARRFPAWRGGAYVDGYVHPSGGWARASATALGLLAQVRAAGVVVHEGARVEHLAERGAIVDGELRAADLVVIANGARAATLVPELAGLVQPIGQPVFHVRPADPEPFAPPRFVVFGADIARTGWYGFPIADGIVKLANHGTGVPVASDAARVVTDAHEASLRAFLADTFPALATAPIAARRLCVYGDTRDGHFLIARHPERANVAVATGGSGHAFKFAPVLGDLIARLVLDEDADPILRARFRWRTDPAAPTADAARFTAPRAR